MEITLTGRRALITGGSRGLGRAMAETFAAAGADLAVLARQKTTLQETVAALEGIRTLGRFVGISADVSDAANFERAHGQAVEFFGPIDVLVNNAGN